MNMKILKQHPSKQYGNDSMIYRTIALIKSNEEYLIIVHERYTGWNPSTNCKVTNYLSYDDALESYENIRYVLNHGKEII